MNAHVIDDKDIKNLEDKEVLSSLIDLIGQLDNALGDEEFQELKKEMLESGMTTADFFNLLGDNFTKTVLSRPIVDVQIQRLTETAKIPTYSHVTDACADIYADEDIVIKPGETYPVSTGLALAIPNGFVVHIYARSGLSMKSGIRLANSVGIIDAGYRDELKILLWNTGSTDFYVEKGMRIAQMNIMESPAIDFYEVDDVKEIPGDRLGGFGSSGLFDLSEEETDEKIKAVMSELERLNGEV